MNFELLATGLAPEKKGGDRLLAENIFRGREGYLGLELWGRDKEFAGAVLPQFFARSGEEIQTPECFRAAARAVTHAVNCVGCGHSHFLTAPDAAARVEQEDSAPVLFSVAQRAG